MQNTSGSCAKQRVAIGAHRSHARPGASGSVRSRQNPLSANLQPRSAVPGRDLGRRQRHRAIRRHVLPVGHGRETVMTGGPASLHATNMRHSLCAGGLRARAAAAARHRSTVNHLQERPMCGIVGYVGPREARPLLLAGLEKLEYRGYDSAGVSVLRGDRIDAVRAVGNLSALRAAIGDRDAAPANGGGARRPAPAARRSTAGPGSATPAGRPTAASPRRTPTRTSTTPTGSTSSSTGSSRTTWPSRTNSRPRAPGSPPRPTPR